MSIEPLNASDLRTFERFYDKRVAEAGGAREDSEELAIATDILTAVVNDGLTPTADGGASYVRRGAVDWTDPATVQAAQTALGAGSQTRSQPQKSRSSQKELLQGIGLATLALLALGWFFWPAGADPAELESDTVALVAAEAEGTEADIFIPTPTPLPTLETELLTDIVEAGTKTKALVVPRTLEVKGVSFVVQPVAVGVGDWPPPEVERAVSWVHGTVINYVLGLEGTPANKALLAGLQPGNQLLLRMSTGVVYRFVYADTVRVAPQAAEIFWQHRPGLTLVLLGDEAETRVVIRALYVPDSDLTGVNKSALTQATPGQRVVLDDKLRLTYLGRQIAPAPAGLRGYAYLGVDVVVEYVGGEASLLTASFMHHIEAAGLSYPMVSVVGPGLHPALPDSLPPDQPFTTTLVYAVPDHALRQAMIWQFAAEPGQGEIVQVTMPPFEGLLTPAVAVTEVGLENGALTLVLEITAALQNLALQPADIQVQGGTISPVGNYFPWQIPAGETDEVILLISPEGSGPVRVTLLEQGIEVTRSEE